MTTSGVTSFSVTRDQIITDALMEIGVLYDGEVATPSMLNDANRKLNMMIKNWMAMDIGLWLLREVTLTLTVGKRSYTLGPTGDKIIPRPLDIVEARCVDTSGEEITMFKISRQDYMDLTGKGDTGRPLQFYFDAQLGNSVLYIWPTTNDNTLTIKMTAKYPVEDFVSAADTPDFPQEWYEPLMWNLAARLMPGYKTIPNVAQMVLMFAKETLETAYGYDREHTSVQFTPDMTGRR